ncbi:L-serine ammonia-lyase, iron-sulfur-dependent, subunit alpha [Collinsella sp. AGMB00827]|uniref:L-serine dehydratase n=1 Tax=Collinsella ureilytica TaxID=2869515 RepID=A0ABS7MHL1_9ACTN|nr:L-serine ammonia-lyase, iron-sulfur-dependent, subunit alpha [Collinsella urealyticum]MBY4796846.1 L-serine ammonia-lyase, iron-sulfur-dependent, subunit alpha [Collinsella urealyticum]
MSAPAQTAANLSAFEILGPIMVGPSSSHTAGALRLARVARALATDGIASISFTLWNSFAHTHEGHGTDRALVAGALGLNTDDMRIKDAFELAQQAGLSYRIQIGGDNEAFHPNSVGIDVTTTSGSTVQIHGESLGGGRIRISRINDIDVDLSGEYTTLFVVHQDIPGALAALTQTLAQDHVNIAFCRTYRTEQGGRAYTIFEMDGAALPLVLPRIEAIPAVFWATFIELPGTTSSAPGVSTSSLFQTGAQLLKACQEHKATIGDLMRRRETALMGKDPSALMKRVIEVMHEETEAPLAHPEPSLGGFLGGQAKAVADASSKLASALTGSVQTNAIARAMAVLERSASMGVIVAAPTAGSAGIVPGCVLALAEHVGASHADVAEALFCAAAIGLILTANASVAGAEGGCQAEVGSAAAMAAAAVTQMLGGSPRQALDAASLALSNLLGLVCDPVAGLVEVPCQTRNAIGVATAFSSAQLALSGVSFLVPFDEMARVMYDVGKALPSSLRETAQGGIAVAPSAQAARIGCAACPRA